MNTEDQRYERLRSIAETLLREVCLGRFNTPEPECICNRCGEYRPGMHELRGESVCFECVTDEDKIRGFSTNSGALRELYEALKGEP